MQDCQFNRHFNDESGWTINCTCIGSYLYYLWVSGTLVKLSITRIRHSHADTCVLKSGQDSRAWNTNLPSYLKPHSRQLAPRQFGLSSSIKRNAFKRNVELISPCSCEINVSCRLIFLQINKPRFTHLRIKPYNENLLWVRSAWNSEWTISTTAPFTSYLLGVLYIIWIPLGINAVYFRPRGNIEGIKKSSMMDAAIAKYG